MDMTKITHEWCQRVAIPWIEWDWDPLRGYVLSDPEKAAALCRTALESRGWTVIEVERREPHGVTYIRQHACRPIPPKDVI